MSEQLVCPLCGSESMVSLECVFQHYPVYFVDGKLEFEGHVLREWYNDNEPPMIYCTNCNEEFSREAMVEHMKELNE